MADYTHLSEERKRAKIIEDFNKGEDIDEIARRVGYHPKSCLRIIKRFSGKKSYKRAKGAGRPQVLGSTDKISIINCLRAKPWLSASKIKERLLLKAQPRTIRLYLESLNYSYRKPYRKPKLSNQDKVNRVDWALKYNNFDFSRIVFADECSIWMNDWQGRMWLKKGSQHFIGTKAYYPKVHVWGGIGKDGVLGIHIFQGNLTAPRFVAILKESLIPAANDMYGKGKWNLAHDNDPKHRALVTQNFLKSEKVISLLNLSNLSPLLGTTVVNWPSRSPDVNPIENVWALLKADVAQKNPKSVEALISTIYDSWKKLDKNSIMNIFNSIYDRVDMLIEGDGEPLPY